MVTMNSDKAQAKRKPPEAKSKQKLMPEPNPTNGGYASSSLDTPLITASHGNPEDSPNYLLYKKIIDKMQDETTGVPVRTVKSFLTKIPSVFTGSDLVLWMIKNMDVENESEALHIGQQISAHGYLFPIDDHILTLRNDNSYYRFQTPYFWPSSYWDPENTEYAVYLAKRTMQNKTRLELADYEAENLARLQKMFSRKWEFIFMQAEAQSKVDKKRDKLERKVLDSQERAFWDVHRPVPGCVNTTEIDIKKACRMNKAQRTNKFTQNASCSGTSEISVKKDASATKEQSSQKRIERNVKVSKIVEGYLLFFEQYFEYDPFFVAPEFPNPWISDTPELWEQEKQAKDISSRRVKRWAFSLKELLQDPIGRENFVKFLEKEFSGENLKFWEAVQELRALPQSQVNRKASEIWSEYLAEDASCPVNIDSHSMELTKKNMENPDRWTFDAAAAHVYHLMKSDSYSRFLRSEIYKEFSNSSQKKTSVKGIRFIQSRKTTFS